MAYTDIDKPSDYFTTKLYSGTGGTQSITTGFQPDFTWIKRRNSARDHCLFNVISGTNRNLSSNLSSAEEGTGAGGWTATSTGFDVGVFNKTNSSGDTYASWNWKTGGTASSNSNGSITSSVSANQDAGFSIVSWTGNNSGSATVGHGLGAVPNVVIIKKRDSATNWGFKHSSFASGAMASINTTDAPSNRNGSTNGGIGNLTSSTTFGFIGGGAGTPEVNNSSMIAYCFAEKQGYSKFGSYVGNGSTDGTFVYLGFKPALFMIKRTDGANNWMIWDNKRTGFNIDNNELYPNESAAEGNDDRIDLLSNGIKWRNGGATCNGSGSTYIYMAFASNPYVTSTGIPATAR